jgi:molybdenum cofactor synthesis domain-containing protein
MIAVSEAVQLVVDKTRPLPVENVPLDAALGRILAEDIIADSDLPPFDRAQMDGYAVRSDDLREVPARLQVVGEAAAGLGWRGVLSAGQAVRIMTGAPLPFGADGVQQVEVTRELDGGAIVEIERTTTPGQFFAPRASEIRKGETVLHVGEEINAARMAVLASFGCTTIRSHRPPRVAILATGSELVPVDQQPGADQIRDSNTYSLAAYATNAGAIVERLPFAGDDPQLLKKLITQAAERSDVVVLSGGVSMGVYDFTKSALKQLDAEIFFERVSLRPGKPTVFARLNLGQEPFVFGLPGNPVSVSVTFNLFARTAIRAMQGDATPTFIEERASLARDTRGALDRASYLPATLRTDERGCLIAEPLKWGGSSDFVAFARATALIILPAGMKTAAAGDVVSVVRLPS